MATSKETKQRIPKFKSIEEEAEFWDSHSPTDYPEEWTEVEGVQAQRPLAHVLGVRLDPRVLDRLAVVGRKKGIGPSTLARIWLMERLAEEDERNPDPPARRKPAALATRSRQ